MKKEKIPGVVIHHVPAKTNKYVGCPSLCILKDGSYLASHSHFGPGASNSNTYLYSSVDKGRTWTFLTRIEGQIWSNLFIHRDIPYIMGTDHCDNYGGRLNGKIVIRKSLDSGKSWSVPSDSNSGLLSEVDGYHTAPMPIISHDGRLWRTMEFAPGKKRITWRTMMLSISEDDDLLKRDNWLFSDMLEHAWSTTQWIEGNAVVDRQNRIANLLRTNYAGEKGKGGNKYIDRAVIVHISEDGRRLSHDPKRDSIRMPGGGTKFTVRYDPTSDKYWSLVNKQLKPKANRNRLYLASSTDLYNWKTERLILEHDDPEYHAFQYVDWVTEDRDIIFVSRTAFDDEEGGAHRQHDANYLTFHRIESFRELNVP